MSVSGYRLSQINNEDPPTVYYLISTVGLLSFFLFFRKSFEEMLHNIKVWTFFSFIHSNIYTIFLWHVFLFFFINIFNFDWYLYPIMIFLVVIILGDYERKLFKLSTKLVQRLNPLQPWPSPIMARGSYSNFYLSWVSALLILIGVLQITLGGVGLSGFFSLRELYFLTGNTFEAFLKLFTGVILLNTTIRRADLKDSILLTASILQIFSLALRYYQYSVFTSFELYTSISLSVFFVWLVLQNRNSKRKNKVK